MNVCKCKFFLQEKSPDVLKQVQIRPESLPQSQSVDLVHGSPWVQLLTLERKRKKEQEDGMAGRKGGGRKSARGCAAQFTGPQQTAVDWAAVNAYPRPGSYRMALDKSSLPGLQI